MPGQYALGWARWCFIMTPLLIELTLSSIHAVTSACNFHDARLLLQLCAKKREMATFLD